MWLNRGPLIHLWVVEHHYPDRVLRQFELGPFILIDPSLPRSTFIDLHKMNHRGRLDRDWSTRLSDYYSTAQDPQYLDFYHEPDAIVQTQGDPQLRYDTWYIQICMASVYLQGNYGTHLRDMINTDDGYHMNGITWARQLLFSIKECAHGIAVMGKKN